MREPEFANPTLNPENKLYKENFKDLCELFLKSYKRRKRVAKSEKSKETNIKKACDFLCIGKYAFDFKDNKVFFWKNA